MTSIPERSLRRPFFGWYVIFAAMLGLVLGASAVSLFTFGVFATPLEREFGWSRVQIAFGATLISYAAMVIAPLQGVLADRFGARRLVLISLPLYCLALAGMYFLNGNIFVFYAAWVVIPLLGLGMWPVGYAKITAAWFDQRLGLAMGIVNAGVGIGAALLPPLTQFVVQTSGWRAGYVALAAITFCVTFPFVLFLLKDRPSDIGLTPYGATGLRRDATDASGLTLSAASKTANFRLLMLTFFLLGAISTGIIAHQVPLLIDAGVTPARAAATMSAFGVSMIAGRIAVGYLLDKFYAQNIMLVLLTCATAAFAIYARSPTDPLMFVAAALIGVTVGGEFDVLGYVVRRYFGMASYGKIYGLLFGIFQFGAGLGALTLGAVRTSQGSYGAGLWAFAALCVLLMLPVSRFTRYSIGSRTDLAVKTA